MARRRNVHWPQDLLNDILLNLPVKSIIRFKCVSKTWNSLIENPSFVSQQLRISKEGNSHLLVSHVNSDTGKVTFGLFLHHSLVDYECLCQKIPQHVDTKHLQICVHDGLLCLCDTINSRISVLNPATRNFRLLPECNENFPLELTETIVHRIGFGSDPFANDYKVIYIRYYLHVLGWSAPPHLYLHLAVYSRNTDSWRLLQWEDDDIFKDLHIPGTYRSACANGICYWVAKKLQSHKVLAFHFSNEVFQLIDWPPVLGSDEEEGLVRLPDNRISLLLSYSDMISRSYEIWGLNDDGERWTKLLRIGPRLNVSRMFGFRNKSLNQVYVGSYRAELLVYDFNTQEFSDTGIKFLRIIRSSGICLRELYHFEESLIAC